MSDGNLSADILFLQIDAGMKLDVCTDSNRINNFNYRSVIILHILLVPA